MNDEHIDHETQEKLHMALEKAKEARWEMEQKRESKLWQNIDVSLDLLSGLQRLTKDELQHIRRNLHLKNVSSLNKQDLIAELLKRIPQEISKALMLFDQDRYSIVKKIINHGGNIPASVLEPEKIEYFRHYGIIFSGTANGHKVLIIPMEILQTLQTIDTHILDSTVKRNSEWIKLTRGLLYYYGTLELKQLEKMIFHFTGTKLKTWEYLQVIFDSMLYHEGIRHDESGCFSNDRVWDPERVKQEHQSRESLEYFPFTKKQLLKAGEPGFVERNSCYRQFLNFLIQNYDIDRDKADMIVEECVYAIRIGQSTANMLQYIQSQFEFDRADEIQLFIGNLTHLHNNTKQWFLKGYSPNELNATENLQPLPKVQTNNPKKADVMNMTTKRKVGRNDPCPCGSGKKYKKCCGK